MQEEKHIFLEAKGLTVAFQEEDGEEAVVQDVCFSVRRGEMVAVVGESGAGKTTLMRACLGLTGPGVKVSGQVLMDLDHTGERTDILSLSRRERQKRIYGKKAAIVFQDTAVCLNPLMTIGSQMAEGIRLCRRRGKKKALQEAAGFLKAAGLEEKILSLYPHQLSGGMRQRIAILLAMIPEPELLICDEPASSLDSLTREQIFEIVEKEQKQREMAVVYITHDLGFAVKKADDIQVMYEGKIVEGGSPAALLQEACHEYTRQLLSAAGMIPAEKKKERSSREEALAGKEKVPVLEAEGLRLSFHGKKGEITKAVDGVSMRIYPGEIYGLVGGSGAGKSTVGRILMHICEPEEGRIRIGGKDFSGKLTWEKKQELYGKVQMIFQDAAACLNPSRRVIDIVAQALDIREEAERKHGRGSVFGKRRKEERKQQVCAMLEAAGLSKEVLYRYPHQLSGGQRQRVGIARILIGNPELVIVDEAVSALDPVMQQKVARLLKEIQEKTGMAMIFISHDIPVVRSICDRIGIMYEGRIIEEGEMEQVFRNPSHAYTKKLLHGEGEGEQEGMDR